MGTAKPLLNEGVADTIVSNRAGAMPITTRKQLECEDGYERALSSAPTARTDT
jgi:hypothetical protein